ncbi:MAG: molybdenum cofactor guanylyltransferase MobA [Paracoccaceae bacterium]
MTVVGVVLAGGRGSRMGGVDKALVTLGGQPMIAHVIARLGPQVGALAINAGGDPARFAGLGLPVLPDPVPGQPGPLAGVLAGMRWAASQGASHVATAATDTPFLPADLVARLKAGAQAPIALAESDGWLHPTFGLWPVTLAEDLELALEAGTRKVAGWALGEGAVRVQFAAEPFDPFFNVNTPDDLATAERILAGERT